jgi:Zn-dependent protease
MDFLNAGIPIGRWFGITVRLHITFLLYAFWRAQGFGNLGYGIAYIAGLYVCILLHEFGHALAARWCDGEAEEILLWPLGGLAYCRPAFHPTAHLITTVAGPFVTFVLALLFGGVWFSVTFLQPEFVGAPGYVLVFIQDMMVLNLWLLIFNLIPAFPMDGGRILRDTLWHWMSAEKATKIAVVVSQIMAILVIAYALYAQDYWLILIAGFILLQGVHEKAIVGFEARGTYQFSIRERLRRGSRRRAFERGVRHSQRAVETEAFHRCTSCGRTERDSPELDFRVCTDCANGEEYCEEHIAGHPHK